MIFLKNILFFNCVICAHECKSPERSEESTGFSGAGVVESYLVWVLGPNSNPLQEQVLFITESSFQPLIIYLFIYLFIDNVVCVPG